MTTITAGRKILTLINVFTVKPENQQRLIDILIEADQSVIKTLPGYISANFHRSLDGTKVTNYTQWESAEALEAMLKHPKALPHLQAIRELAEKVEPGRYEVVYSEALA
jgi:heme-degrading monooxygenase HmoA